MAKCQDFFFLQYFHHCHYHGAEQQQGDRKTKGVNSMPYKLQSILIKDFMVYKIKHVLAICLVELMSTIMEIKRIKQSKKKL